MNKRFFKVIFVIAIVSMFLFALTNNVFAAKEVTKSDIATKIKECANMKYFENMSYTVELGMAEDNVIGVSLNQGVLGEGVSCGLVCDSNFIAVPYKGSADAKDSMQYRIMQDVAEYAIKNGEKSVPETKEELDTLIANSVKILKVEDVSIIYVDLRDYGITIKMDETTTTNKDNEIIRNDVRNELGVANQSYVKNTVNTTNTTNSVPANKVTYEKIPAAGLNVNIIRICAFIIAISIAALILYTIKDKRK